MESAHGVSGAAWEDVTQMKTPPFDTENADDIQETLKQHGCQIDVHREYYILTFPSGTQKIQIRPTSTVAPYKIRFPDGYLIYETFDCMNETSYLQLPKEVQG